jgi:hypothetical protein
MAETPDFVPNKRFGVDMFNVVIGIVAQITLTLLPIYAVLAMKTPLLITIGILAITLLILRKTWWKQLDQQN